MSAESSPQVYTDVSVDPFVRGFLYRPERPNGQGLVLTHGAGSNCQAPLLIAVAESFSSAGFLVLRCDLPFRQDRRMARLVRTTANATVPDCRMQSWH